VLSGSLPYARYSCESQGQVNKREVAVNLMEHICKWVSKCKLQIQYMVTPIDRVMCKSALSENHGRFHKGGELECILKDKSESVKGSWDWKVERHPR